jgi:Flp pilus assembly pilin Flp
MSAKRTNRNRVCRGVSTVEFTAVVGLVAVAIIWGVFSVGTAVDSHLTTTATDIGSPAALATSKSKSKANNGLGNGSDDGTPGNAPENDGAGTSPGNPGKKGGKKK